MPKYTYNSQAADNVTITTMEQAKRIILATATVREHTQEELLNDPQLNEVASIFGLDLNDITVENSKDPQDFCFTYEFK